MESAARELGLRVERRVAGRAATSSAAQSRSPSRRCRSPSGRIARPDCA
jgi:hypothetical protein